MKTTIALVALLAVSLTADLPDQTPLSVATQPAFAHIKWPGWSPESDAGRPNEFRPIVLTHAADASGRLFLASQHGQIYVFRNDDTTTEAKLFLDISDRVTYKDTQNEEGFLGLAFHPKYKQNGEFFVYYTTSKAKLTNIVARFRVSKDDPDKADPNSEEQLVQIKKPFWNHDGGTVCFGPDGFLYFTHGDGGAANDPFDNGQNLQSWLGKIHRIDVDRRDAGKTYAVPKDNPFVGRDNAKPEIWAYGLRNVWRMAFDRETGDFWAADVGQDKYEEIDLITKGGNYGWNRREGMHPFGRKGVGPNDQMIEPIWEYHHDVGKSITGGFVYRGKAIPELQGHYLFGDYVSCKLWALKYDREGKRVIAHRPLADSKLPIHSFGEDDVGEAYVLTASRAGRGIHRFVKK